MYRLQKKSVWMLHGSAKAPRIKSARLKEIPPQMIPMGPIYCTTQLNEGRGIMLYHGYNQSMFSREYSKKYWKKYFEKYF